MRKLLGDIRYKLAGVPRGGDLHRDLKLDPRTVFDVGANIGQTAEYYLRKFPRATIYSFEPVRKNFNQLAQRFAGNPRVKAEYIALGSKAGMLEMVVEGDDTMFHVAKSGEQGRRETVQALTLDGYCSANGPETIDFLKIDTEGHDLEVLKGADRLLSERKIGAVQVEVGMNPTNTHHVPLEAVKSYMEGKSYHLFGFYEQVGEWPTNEPHLRRANAVFLPR